MLKRVRSVHTVLAITLCAALVVSCGSDPDEAVNPVAETYILVIDWVLAEPQFALEVEPDELPVVFVESLGPADIELVVQVAVVGHFIDTADIHFIDSRIEALEEIEGAPVRDSGLLLGLGGVAVDGSADVRGEIYRTPESIVGYHFPIDRTGRKPVMTQPPTQVEPEGLVADQ